MSIKTIILSIAIITTFYPLQASLTQKTTITTKDFADSIKKKLQSKQWSCIVDNRYQSQFYIDDYLCGKTEDLKKVLPWHSDYPYMMFDVMWHYKRGKDIKDKTKKDKVLFGLNVRLINTKSSKDTSTREVFIIDGDSKYLWKVLKEYTCFLMYDAKMVSIKKCK